MIADWARDRGITEILHYTTSRGVLGVLASRALKSRKRLPEDDYLEHVWMPVCAVRYDTYWLDYVNLSISDINSALYTIASGKWHATERWWGVLSFTPNPALPRLQALDLVAAHALHQTRGSVHQLGHEPQGVAVCRP